MQWWSLSAWGSEVSQISISENILQQLRIWPSLSAPLLHYVTFEVLLRAAMQYLQLFPDEEGLLL